MTPNLSAMMNTASNLPRERLIFALDIGGGLEEALSWVDRLRDHVGLFKVGKESFVRYGTEIVRQIHARGGRVFLDLKFHDIPNTVVRAAEAATELGVAMFNLHALGGREMMTETVGAVRKFAERSEIRPPVVLAVTVLTSLNNSDLIILGFSRGTGETALQLARLAQDAGVSGVVASAADAAAIRKACGGDFLIVTPGIRGVKEVAGDDQKRIMTPSEAVRCGADYLVVGRPIRQAADPAGEADAIVGEIARGLCLETKDNASEP
ncbi:MAG: orotidine-5'-phosphate decarboxylase [Syntrophaceae bacterium]|nr:orotidine-5'-phosphate decarboxylase [Syntrophaceae bacterium]